MPTKKNTILLAIISGLVGLNGLAGAPIGDIANDLEREKAAHQHLFETVLNNYSHYIRIQPNTQEEILTEITLYEGELVVDVQASLNLGADVAAHMFRFSFLEVEGQDLTGIQRMGYRNEYASENVNITERTRQRLRVPGRYFSDFTKTHQTLILRGSGTINTIRLVSLEGIPKEFDETIFITPGYDRPPTITTLTVDATRGLSLQGISELPTENFFRLYFSPDGDRSGKEAYFAQRGFLPGRQIFKLGPELETRYDTFDEPLLREDKERPGFADLSFFNYAKMNRFRKVDSFLRFVHSLDDWPSFMTVDIPGLSNTRGTPAEEHFPAAAELAGAFIAAEIRDSGRTADWWEVKNESDIQYEWTFHGLAPRVDSWKLLADFHNQVARAVKAESPSVLVGGPASAWPQLHRGNPRFNVWHQHRRFMDMTRGELDFYSHHFYDRGVPDSYSALRSEEGYDGWLQGRLECVLDMFQAHMHATDNRRPLLITEFGTLTGGVRDVDFWMRINNYSSFLMHFLRRPAEIELTVPFLLGYMHWEPDSGVALIHRDQNGKFFLTKNRYFIDLWEGVRGTYLPIESRNRRIQTLAWLDGKTIHIAINNLSGERVLVNHNILLPDAVSVISTNYRTATYRNGSLQFIRNTNEPLIVGIGETAIMEVKLDSAPMLDVFLQEEIFYSVETAMPANDDVEFTIVVPEAYFHNDYSSAVLRIGVETPNGLSKALSGTFNGISFSIEEPFDEDIKPLFDFVEVEVEPKSLKSTNKIVLKIISDDIYFTHARLTLRSSHSVENDLSFQ